MIACLHYLQNCHTASCKRQVLQKAGRCSVCLQRGHISRECRSNSRCSNCRDKHHITFSPNTLTDSVAPGWMRASILDDPTPSQVDPPANSVTQSPGKSPILQTGLNARAASFQTTRPWSTSLWVNSDRAVLLQTAQALLFNPSAPQVSQSVRIILDCGSQ